MITANQRLDSIVRNLKSFPEFSQVRFVREYTDKPMETPVSGFLAVAGIKSAAPVESYLGGLVAPLVRGWYIRAEAEIRVYAPKSQNGNGLSELAGEMLYRLEDADGENIVTEAKAGAIEFDTNVSAVFRRLSFVMEYAEGGDE